ncbi:MAG: MoxR family ATPase [Lachnospiraceae bacterium]|nr:MoxR family ATPase [Lachnospiraceae bacterium]
MEQMNVKTVKRALTECVRVYLEKDESGQYRLPQNKQRPVFLCGPAGIGKTELAAQVAEELELGFVSYSLTHHTRQSAVGMPAMAEREFEGKTYRATEYTMSEIVDAVYGAMRAGHREGILFVDEVNCVSEMLSAVMLQFLQSKCFGTHRIPEGWVIVTAGNPPEYNRSVRSFDAVTTDRLRTIEIAPDVNVWMEYADRIGVHPIVMSYVRDHPDSFYQYRREQGTVQIVTARGWEDLSNAILANERLGFPVDDNLVRQFIRMEETAVDFANSYRFLRAVLTSEEIDAVLRGENIPDIAAKVAKTAQKRKHDAYQIRWFLMMLFLSKLRAMAAPVAAGWKTGKRGDTQGSGTGDGEADGQQEDCGNPDQADGQQGVRGSLDQAAGVPEDLLRSLDEWHVSLRNVLQFLTFLFQEGSEMEYFISALCTDRRTGYLLALKGNDSFRQIAAQMNRIDGKQTLAREMKKLAAEEGKE